MFFQTKLVIKMIRFGDMDLSVPYGVLGLISKL